MRTKAPNIFSSFKIEKDGIYTTRTVQYAGNMVYMLGFSDTWSSAALLNVWSTAECTDLREQF